MRRAGAAGVLSVVGLMVGMIAGGARGAAAQTIDPITGMMVMPADPTADPTTYATQISQNVILQADQAMYQAQQAAQQASQQASQDAMNAMNAASTNDDTPPSPIVVQTPKTPKPTLVLTTGAVSIQDADQNAVLFYTTDGRKPTTSSIRYAGPVAIHGKVKVEALAFDVNEMPSSVATKTFVAAN